MADHGAWVGLQASRKSPAAPSSGGPGHRQRVPLCWHSGGRGFLSRKCPPPPEWHRCSSPGTPAEERAGGRRRGAARGSAGRACSVSVPLLLASFFSNVLYVTIIVREASDRQG